MLYYIISASSLQLLGHHGSEEEDCYSMIAI